MDIKWKDEEGNILNADNEKIKYLTSDNGKTVLTKAEVKKITIDDGLMNIFKDFKNDLVLTVVVPKGHNKDAVKIFNEYDKTGNVLKRKSSNFFIDLILESSVITYNPFTGLIIILFSAALLFALTVSMPIFIFGADLGLIVSRVLIISLIAYVVMSHVLLRIKRRNLKEIG